MDEPAVHREHGPVDERGAVGRQPDVGLGDVVGLAHASQGSVVDHGPQHLVGHLAHDVGLDERKLARAFQNRKVRYKLKKDILEGIKMGVRGTPSFVIGGKVYQGQIPPEILKSALE